MSLVRQEVMMEASSSLAVKPENEKDVVSLAQVTFKKRKNTGYPVGLFNLTEDAELDDIACPGAYPVTCSSEAKYRTMTGLCNNLEHMVRGVQNEEALGFNSSVPVLGGSKHKDVQICALSLC